MNWARIKRYVSEDLWNPSSRAKRIIQKRIERKQGRNVSTYFESMIRPNAFSRDIHAQGYVVICKTRSKEVSFFFLSISFPEDDKFVSFRKSLIQHWYGKTLIDSIDPCCERYNDRAIPRSKSHCSSSLTFLFLKGEGREEEE